VHVEQIAEQPDLCGNGARKAERLRSNMILSTTRKRPGPNRQRGGDNDLNPQKRSPFVNNGKGTHDAQGTHMTRIGRRKI
jgi:hypothetical protein